MATVANRKKVSILQFEDLPVEIRIKVMSCLDLKELLRCNQVSKKTRALCQDESLWQKIDLSWKDDVPYSFVQFVLEKKCKSLLLRGSEMMGRTLKLTKMSHLRHLDLGQCEMNERGMNELLFSCHNLKRLSLEYLSLEPHTVKSICLQNGKSLQTLDLETWGMGDQLKSESIPDIADYCVELRELNLSLVHLSKNSLHYLANNLTPKILKLSLRGCTNLTDEHLKTLVTRCNKITELDLSQCDRLTSITLTNIIENLKYTLEKLDVTFCFGTEPDIHGQLTKLYDLKSMLFKFGNDIFITFEMRGVAYSRPIDKIHISLQFRPSVIRGLKSNLVSPRCILDLDYVGQSYIADMSMTQSKFCDFDASFDKCFDMFIC